MSNETPKLRRYTIVHVEHGTWGIQYDTRDSFPFPQRLVQPGDEFYLAADVDPLIERLREYTRHKWDCEKVTLMSGTLRSLGYVLSNAECTCGLDQLLAELEGNR